jgi:hypothetical protein
VLERDPEAAMVFLVSGRCLPLQVTQPLCLHQLFELNGPSDVDLNLSNRQARI